MLFLTSLFIFSIGDSEDFKLLFAEGIIHLFLISLISLLRDDITSIKYFMIKPANNKIINTNKSILTYYYFEGIKKLNKS